MVLKKICTVVIFVLLMQQSAGSGLRLVGGFDAPTDYGKFHVSLQNLTGSHVCGGAVVSKLYAVTAAHCLFGASPEYIKLVVGTTNLDVGGQQYEVEAIEMHPDYDYSLRINDIALVKINSIFDENVVNKLEIEETSLLEGDPVTLTGFGALTANGESSRTMYALNMSVFNQEVCVYAMRYSREVVDSMFCTFTQIGEGTCHGDSGGPIMKNNKLVGLVSWGIPCAVGFPDVHTRISPYTQWIKKYVN